MQIEASKRSGLAYSADRVTEQSHGTGTIRRRVHPRQPNRPPSGGICMTECLLNISAHMEYENRHTSRREGELCLPSTRPICHNNHRRWRSQRWPRSWLVQQNDTLVSVCSCLRPGMESRASTTQFRCCRGTRGDATPSLPCKLQISHGAKRAIFRSRCRQVELRPTRSWSDVKTPIVK